MARRRPVLASPYTMFVDNLYVIQNMQLSIRIRAKTEQNVRGPLDAVIGQILDQTMEDAGTRW